MNLEELKQRVLKNTLGCEGLSSELEELEAKLQDPSVWSDQKLASEIGQQVREIKDKISLFNNWNSILDDAQTALEIGDEELIAESEKSLIELEKQLDKYYFLSVGLLLYSLKLLSENSILTKSDGCDTILLAKARRVHLNGGGCFLLS